MNNENLNNRGIKDIQISETRKFFLNKKRNFFKNNDFSRNRIKHKKGFIKIFGVLLFLVAVVGIISILFHRAEIELTLIKNEHIFSNSTFVAQALDKTPVLLLENEEKKQEKVISGKIKIFNKTSDIRPLIKNTRFQTEEGLIFRIRDSVKIPANGEKVVKVFSEETKEKYKIKKDRKLTIPGLKNNKQLYKKTYAITESDFVIISENEIAQLITDKENISFPVIGYKILTFNKKEEKKIPSIGVEEIEKKAIGKIKIINNTSRARKLVKNTRFQTKEGLVFRIERAVTIPARSNATVDARADKVGGAHNIEAGADLTIPGFKEANLTNLFENVKGVIEVNFTGGKVGKNNIPDKNSLAEAKVLLKNKLNVSLDEEIRKKIVSGKYIFIKDIYDIQYRFKTSSVENEILVTKYIEKKIVVVPEKEFIKKALLSDEITIEDIKDLDIRGIYGLDIRVLQKDNQNFSELFKKGESFKFTVTGKIEIIEGIDKKLFKELISGKNKKEYTEQIARNYPNIEANISVFPFWRSSIPQNVDKIEIIIK